MVGSLGSRCLAYLAINRLPSIRWSTKIEVYKSLCKGRAYIARNHSSKVCLDDAAGAAGISPHHFHRLFRVLFRETPGEFLIRTRLHFARRKLECGDPIGRIAVDAGFASPSAFAAMFKKKYGETPSVYRKRKISTALESEQQ